ncbi:hypothetical protein V3W47_16535 [Deinococcus sp. YIM 134068]|uniref:hypothetical protein n=1 Tax=Deinococcus lichenicola TaxID=3118910 RepID=UPI002F94D5F2
MPNYQAWNTALLEHATHGAPLGSTVYLEVSDETLNRIGVQWWGPPPPGSSWRADFLGAVHKNSIYEARVCCDWMAASDPQGRPVGVAFLAAMVLAASNMATDAAGQLHEKNYFKRLAAVLGVPPSPQGRPPGLPTGAEEPLWQAWVAYLRGRGLDSTARGGEGAQRFIAYPISQCLIAEGQKQRLRRLFAERGYPAGWDGETLASRLRADGELTKKLAELLSRTGAAAEDVHDALQGVLQDFHASGGSADVTESTGVGPRQLVAGLYRGEHWRTGEPEYQLFPRQPRGVRLTRMAVQFPGGAEVLDLERPGYYRPVGEVTLAELTRGVRLEVAGNPFVDALVLPARDYWLLRRDPDAEGMFASLGTPGVGEHLLLLVRDTLLPDLRRFQEEGLVAWTGQPDALGEGWVEVRDLMVIGNHWSEVPAGQARALHEALRPPGGVSIHLEGGARTQRAGAYLAGAGPDVRVMSFSLDAHLTVCRDGEEVFAAGVTPGEVLSLPLDSPGTFELSAESRGQHAVRTLTVVPWEELRAAPVPPERREGMEVNGRRIWGAYVQDL